MKPDPELIDDEAPEWTDEMNARAMSLSSLAVSLQKALIGERPTVVLPNGMQQVQTGALDGWGAGELD